MWRFLADGEQDQIATGLYRNGEGPTANTTTASWRSVYAKTVRKKTDTPSQKETRDPFSTEDRAMTDSADPDYSRIISREGVQAAADGNDKLAQWAQEMLAATDEEAVFIRGARTYFRNVDQERRRAALTYLAVLFKVERKQDLKRYLRFKGIVNLMD
jgi:hypothetical protein